MEICHERALLFQKVCQKYDHSELRELYWLERRKSWDIEPSASTIVLHSDEEDKGEKDDDPYEDDLTVFLEYRI